jgi:hypothetical protein
MRLGKPQNQSGRYGEEKNVLPLPESNPNSSSFKPITSRNTEGKKMLIFKGIQRKENFSCNALYAQRTIKAAYAALESTLINQEMPHHYFIQRFLSRL